MLTVDSSQEAQLPEQPVPHVLNTPTRVVEQIDLNDESISPGLRRDISSIEDLQSELTQYLERAHAREDISEVFKSFARGDFTDNTLQKINERTLHYATSYEKGSMLKALVQSDLSEGQQTKALTILANVNCGANLSLAEQSRFVAGLDLTSVTAIGALFGLVNNPKQVSILTDTLVTGMLRKIASTLPDAGLRAKYQDESLTQRQLLEVLRYASSIERLSFIRTVTDMAKQNPQVAQFVTGKLDNVLHFTTPDERVTLIREGLSQVDSHLGALLRASKNQAELEYVVKQVGVAQLMKTGRTGVQELVAQAVLGAEFRSAPLPAKLGDKAKPADIDATLDAIKDALSRRMEIVLDQDELIDTATSKDYLTTALYDSDYLDQERKVGSPEELRSLANMMIEKIALEFKYGMRLTHEEAGVQGPGAKWTEATVLEAKNALAKLREGLVITTPQLTEIQRVTTLGPNVMGQRFPSGVIKISNFAVDNLYVALAYPGGTSLESTLVHEIGHGVQLGTVPFAVKRGENGAFKLGLGDTAYDFEEFLAISGWELIDPSRFKANNQGFSVILDGTEYPLGTPIKHQGRDIILVGNQGLLFARDAYAPFSVVPYSRTNPWEDFAEAFAEYHLVPERLIKFAPEKFQFLEQEFRKYENKPELLKLLDAELKTREQIYGKHPLALVDGFLKLVTDRLT